VVHATGLREIDRMGGLARFMPRTAIAFLIGAIAICGLPPLNGFVSEFLLMLGMIGLVVAGGEGAHVVSVGGANGWIIGAIGVSALALVGGLAMLCFAKVFGVVFLGEPRSDEAARAHRTPREMVIPMVMLGSLCVLIGVAPLVVSGALDASIGAWHVANDVPALAQVAPLAMFTLIAVVLAPVIGLGWLVLRPSRSARVAAAAAPIPTWGCAFTAPTPRMQYTGSSFAQMLIANFRFMLAPVESEPRLGLTPFPAPSDFAAHTRDPALDLVIVPTARGLARLLEYTHRLQSGSVHMSLFCVLIALFVAFLML
jgi:hydrogenase-4 component B